MNLKRLYRLFFLRISALPMPSTKWRPIVVKLGGVNVVCPEKTFIGANVWFDSDYPDDITIEERVTLTLGCTIFTHYVVFRGNGHNYRRGKVRIKKHAWIGARTIICQSVTIGENAVIGAGSVVTKDVPDNEVWAGNPARFIKMRNGFTNENSKCADSQMESKEC